MRKIREILRLNYECKLSHRAIGACLGVGKSTVKGYLNRARLQNLSWPLPETWDDADLEACLFAPTDRETKKVEIDFEALDKEYRRKHVTLMLLWYEYKKANPKGLQYSQFCKRFRDWRAGRDVVMRQSHRAGEKMFVDYAGSGMEVQIGSGKVRRAQIFVAVLGASNYTYAEATWTQNLEDWVGSHIRAFHYWGGVPALLIPDNLKSGVSTANRYEPKLNETYLEMACHYQAAIMPARVGKPKDKAKAEQGVLLVERWIAAALRHQTFYSLEEVNQAIATLLERLNRKSFKKMKGSRREHFLTLDKPALKPLPTRPYEMAYWQLKRVGMDYHVSVAGHHYSVPHGLTNKEVEVRSSATTVEIFFKNRRVAVHPHATEEGGFTTRREHMPQRHRAYAEWTATKARDWAAQCGDCTQRVVEHLLTQTAHPLIGLRACAGLAQLNRGFGTRRLEAACRRAVAIEGYSYTSIKSILERGLDRLPLDPSEQEPRVSHHPNVRGPAYYQAKEDGHVAPSNP